MTVWILFEAYGSDTPSFVATFSSQEAVDQYMDEQHKGEDDYTASRRYFTVIQSEVRS